MGTDLRKKYNDPDYYKRIGSRGGKAGDKRKGAQTAKERYGEAFHSVIGKKAVIAKRKKNAK